MSSFRVVAGSALGSKCRAWQVRASSRARSGWVLAASFGTAAAAASFAARWAARLGLSVVVRRLGGLFVVSVPVVR